MKNVIRTPKFFFALLIFCSAIFFVAQSKAEEKKVDNQEETKCKTFHQEMKKFHDDEVFPQLVKWKEEIDSKLSKEELETLNELRAKAKTIREKRLKQRKALINQKKEDQKIEKKSVWNQHRQFRKEHTELLKAAKKISFNHMEEFDQFQESAIPVIETWMKQQAKAHKQIRAENKKLQGKTHCQARHCGHGSHPARHNPHLKGKCGQHHQQKTHGPTRLLKSLIGYDITPFLLWDGTKIDFTPPHEH